MLQWYANNPRPIHWNAVIHVVTYLKGTITYQLTYKQCKGETDLLKPTGYADASHTSIQEENGMLTQKSTMGYVFLVAEGAVSWSSAKQRTVALSTTEAEYVVMVNAGKQAIWDVEVPQWGWTSPGLPIHNQHRQHECYCLVRQDDQAWTHKAF
ncbi:hypothetical protein MPER_12975 [Moniliophthora perniciosa FA553]|nr:hypothetical protein MPER_12975 [Moniliophthora perniciosa FA553]